MTERGTDNKDTGSTGTPEREAAGESVGITRGSRACPAPFNMRRRIGSTSYEVEVYFSPESGETMDDKILRLVSGGGCEGKGLGK